MITKQPVMSHSLWKNVIVSQVSKKASKGMTRTTTGEAGTLISQPLSQLIVIVKNSKYFLMN